MSVSIRSVSMLSVSMLSIFKLNVSMLSVFKLNVSMLSVFMLSVFYRVSLRHRTASKITNTRPDQKNCLELHPLLKQVLIWKKIEIGPIIEGHRKKFKSSPRPIL